MYIKDQRHQEFVFQNYAIWQAGAVCEQIFGAMAWYMGSFPLFVRLDLRNGLFRSGEAAPNVETLPHADR